MSLARVVGTAAMIVAIAGASLTVRARAADPLAPTALTSDPIRLEPVRLGPSCHVTYRESIQQMVHAVTPALTSLSRAELTASGSAWNAVRFDSGVVAHQGPVTVVETDLAKLLPAGVVLPPSLEAFDLVFVHPADPHSDALLTALGRSRGPDGPAKRRSILAFLVNVTGEEFRTARTRLPPEVRAAFPASRDFARFLGVGTYPALVEVRSGTARVIAGNLTPEELEAHGF